MKLVIFGATGIVGKAIVNEALRQEHIVTILTRNALKCEGMQHPHLRIVEGDVTNSETVHNILKGQEVVIQALGIDGKGDGKPTFFVSQTNQLIMDEMQALNIKRFIAISAIGAGDSIHFLPWVYRKFILPLFMKWFKAIIDDKNRMEQQIKQTQLDWTIVRCTTVKSQPAKGHIIVTFDGKGLHFSITAADMATFIVNQATKAQFIKQSPTISN